MKSTLNNERKCRYTRKMIVYNTFKTLLRHLNLYPSRLAQSVEHETLNLGVVGSSPTLGVYFAVSYDSVQ